MAYINSAGLAIDSNFQQVVKVAMVTVALSIMTEASNTTAHAQRVALAEGVLQNPNSYINSFALAVACNPAIPATFSTQLGQFTTTATDSDIQFTVNSDFNALAGISS